LDFFESTSLSESRRQLHHAAQLAAAAGMSFLDPQPDDNQSSLEWVPGLAGLFSQPIPAPTLFRIGVRPSDAALLIAIENDQPFAEFRLHGKTILDAVEWIRTKIASLGADPHRYTLRRHYEIPDHAVSMGDAFDTSDRPRFEELSKWFADGASLLSSIARSIHKSSDVRCWPHHFDIASLIRATSDRTIGIGLEPGDQYYDEPYFYVNIKPRPSGAAVRSRPLWGRGAWHTRDWTGAVLPGSKLGAASAQEQQVREFIDSAISACRGLATQS
jgi:hypothetical protein